MEQCGDLLRWYAIHTHPQQEGRADSNLTAWGVETFSPRLKARRLNEFTGATTFVSRPMFPRYIFARFDAYKLLHKVWYTRGVHSVVSVGNTPAWIDDEIIEFLRSRVDGDGHVRMFEKLEYGDKVVVTQGPLKNFAGVFEKGAKNSERVTILLDTVNYQGSVTLDGELVRKVSRAA
jgi:transcription elongation factor/antiterminator RfaH